jgi:hypothetical protein
MKSEFCFDGGVVKGSKERDATLERVSMRNEMSSNIPAAMPLSLSLSLSL